MNYYEHHLGDYLKDTLGLSMLQEGAYRRLLDSYYSREEGIPKDQAYLIARANSKQEKAAVDFVLGAFFKLNGKVWRKARCDQEIAKYRDKINKRRLAGIASGNTRRTHVEQVLEQTGEQKGNSPVSSLQSPVLRKESEAKNGLSEPRNRSSELRSIVSAIAQDHRTKESRR